MTVKKDEGKPASDIAMIRDTLRQDLRSLGIENPLYEGIQGTFGGGRMRRRERQRGMLEAMLIAAAQEGISPIVVVPRRTLSDYVNSYAGYGNFENDFANSGGGKNSDKQAA